MSDIAVGWLPAQSETCIRYVDTTISILAIAMNIYPLSHVQLNLTFCKTEVCSMSCRFKSMNPDFLSKENTTAVQTRDNDC